MINGFYIFGTKKQKRSEMATRPIRKRRLRKPSISFSLAFSHVCDWSRDPVAYGRPRKEELDLAEIHAGYVGDKFIIEEIARCRKEWDHLDNTPTPVPPARRSIRSSSNTKPYAAIAPRKMVEISVGDNNSSPPRKDSEEYFERILAELDKKPL